MSKITFDDEISFEVAMSTIAFEEGETLLHIYCDWETKMDMYEMARACKTFKTVTVSDGLKLEVVTISSIVIPCQSEPMVLGLR